MYDVAFHQCPELTEHCCRPYRRYFRKKRSGIRQNWRRGRRNSKSDVPKSESLQMSFVPPWRVKQYFRNAAKGLEFYSKTWSRSQDMSLLCCALVYPKLSKRHWRSRTALIEEYSDTVFASLFQALCAGHRSNMEAQSKAGAEGSLLASRSGFSHGHLDGVIGFGSPSPCGFKVIDAAVKELFPKQLLKNAMSSVGPWALWPCGSEQK